MVKINKSSINKPDELLNAGEARKQSLKRKAEIEGSAAQRRQSRIIRAIQKAIMRGKIEVFLPQHKVNKDEQQWLTSKGYQVRITHPPHIPRFTAIISWV